MLEYFVSETDVVVFEDAFVVVSESEISSHFYLVVVVVARVPHVVAQAADQQRCDVQVAQVQVEDQRRFRKVNVQSLNQVDCVFFCVVKRNF